MSNNKKQPDQLLIDSMAMRYRHDFGLLTFEEQQSIRVTMTQLWKEVVGLGFYKPKHKTMSNNKQISVEWYIIERHIIEIQSRLGLISPIEYDAKLIKIEEQAKAMHKEEHHNTYNQGLMSNFQNFEQCYNETYGGNK